MQLLTQLAASRPRFDDANLCFFGITVDPEDERQRRVRTSLPGVRYIWDFDRRVSGLYGALQADGTYRRITHVLDPMLRVLAVLPFQASVDLHMSALLAVLDRLPTVGPSVPVAAGAPVLVLPRVFEPKLCQALIDYYRNHVPQPRRRTLWVYAGPQRQDGAGAHKSRRDCTLEDEELRQACRRRIQERVIPEIHKAFQFRATRMERYLVGCYDASEGGHFRAQRDNTTKGTAHRCFAISLFRNSGSYEGGFLRFPEFGPGAVYRASRRGGGVLLRIAARGQSGYLWPALYVSGVSLRRAGAAHSREKSGVSRHRAWPCGTA